VRYDVIENIPLQGEILDLIRLYWVSGRAERKKGKPTNHTIVRLPEFPERLLDFLSWDENGIFSSQSSILAEFVEDVTKGDI
jgi:hypothetical protein